MSSCTDWTHWAIAAAAAPHSGPLSQLSPRLPGPAGRGPALEPGDEDKEQTPPPRLPGTQH